jgi:hypothetical protein
MCHIGKTYFKYMDINHIKMPLKTIPFKEIPSLENISYQYVDCSYFDFGSFKVLNCNLLTVYNSFDSDEDLIYKSEPLFGRVISETPAKRGADKLLK